MSLQRILSAELSAETRRSVESSNPVAFLSCMLLLESSAQYGKNLQILLNNHAPRLLQTGEHHQGSTNKTPRTQTCCPVKIRHNMHQPCGMLSVASPIHPNCAHASARTSTAKQQQAMARQALALAPKPRSQPTENLYCQEKNSHRPQSKIRHQGALTKPLREAATLIRVAAQQGSPPPAQQLVSTCMSAGANAAVRRSAAAMRRRSDGAAGSRRAAAARRLPQTWRPPSRRSPAPHTQLHLSSW